MRSVTIEWEGSFCLDYVIDELNRKDDYGLYQIYGHHIVYGANSLLYIGKAESLTFSQRFSQHRSGWLSEEEGVSIRIGRIASEDHASDPPDGQIGGQFSEMLKRLQSTGIHLHIIHRTLKPTTVSNSRLRTEETVVPCVQSILNDHRKMWATNCRGGF